MEAAQAPGRGPEREHAAARRLRLVLSGEVDVPELPDTDPPDESRLGDAVLHEAALEEEALRIRARYDIHGMLAEEAKRLIRIPEKHGGYRDVETNRRFAVITDSDGRLESIMFEDPEIDEKGERSRTIRYERYIREEVTIDPSQVEPEGPRKYSVWKREDLFAEVDNETHETVDHWYGPAAEVDTDEVTKLHAMVSEITGTISRPRAN
ncbi:MAG: hypothetical protein WD603_03730 [Patescibacteria group bacterium]